MGAVQEKEGTTMSDEPYLCTVCGLTEPREWCWREDIQLSCPFRKPPRHLTVEDLWQHAVEARASIVDLRRRIDTLEQKDT